MAAEERTLLLESWNRTEMPYPRHLCIHQLFEQQVTQTPDATALVYQDQSLSYRELNAQANRLAHHLIGLGVRPDEPVALCLERSPAMIVGLLAILKAGGAYVPLDPAYPAQRLAQILTEAAPRWLLCDRIGRHALGESANHNTMAVLDLTACTDWATLPESNPDPNILGLSSQHLAYIIYTSGSTGTPKGVMVPHSAVVNFLTSMQRELQVGPKDSLLSVTTISFDIAALEIFLPLVAGTKLVQVEREAAADATRLRALFERHAVSMMQATPTTWQLLLNGGWQGQSTLVALVGGEAFPRDLSAKLLKRVRALWNLYGPTETTIWSCSRQITAVSDAHIVEPIGRPIANTRIYLLDARGEPVPLSATGEIYIGGDGVARGYLHRPELTAERFLTDPFSPHPNARMYRTGDLARYLPDGNLEFLGRNDHQIKLRGFRVELGEIEAVLQQHPAVKHAVVTAREEGIDGRRLVAYVVGNRGGGDDAATPSNTHDLQNALTGQWEALWEGTYKARAKEMERDFDGWNSSYTGKQFPEVQLQEWLAQTVARIQVLLPTRVLEIGCGLGLVLQRIAPRCKAYVGIDFSAIALERLQHWMQAKPELSHIQLLNRSARELHDLPSGSFDTVVLNSVVQYFPDVEYLLAVLSEAIRLIRPGGRIFIGDVRHLGLLSMFHSAVQLNKAPATMTVGKLRRRIIRAQAQEKELLIDPRFFLTLSARLHGIEEVEVQLKRGHSRNELTSYRYDVVLQKGDGLFHDPVFKELQWSTATTETAELERVLTERRWSAMRLTGIPNARLSQEVEAQRLIETSVETLDVRSLRHQLNEMSHDGVDPETLWELGLTHGYDVQVSWSDAGKPGTMMARFVDLARRDTFPRDAPKSHSMDALCAYANKPLEGAFQQHLAPTLRAHLAARLPEYMVPAAFVQLQTLPLTPNGKLDRNALPAPEADAFAREMYEPPQGPIEQRLALIWEELLGVANIGRHDDFFELGGHSLLAVRLLSRLPGIFGIELPMAELYTHPVLCALAATVDATQQQPGAQILPAITPCERKGYLPLSFAQQRMWFLAQLEGVSQTYHVLLGLQLHGPLDSVAWQDSLNALFARHEALRSVFISLDGQPHVELLSPESGIALIKHDLRGTADAQQQLKRLRTEEATTPFDLARGPLIRARLIRLADQEHLFLLTQHHIVSDGWSMGVLAQELSALYEAFCQGRPNPLTPLAIQYPDYAAWQRRYLTGERQQAHAQYWRETLTGAPDFLALPTDRPRPPEQSFLGAHVPLRIDAQTTAALKRLGQQHGTTLFMTLMAAWATVLSRLSGQSELLIGTPTANRNRREIEPLLGLFVNTLALRIDLSGEPSVAELLLRVRHIALAAQDHQELPFEQVVEILQPPRRLDRTPLVQVMFGWQNNEQSRFALPHLTVSPAPDTYDQVRFDLELTLREEHEGISGILIYAAALFDPATIERHVGYLQNALRAMTVDSQQPVARLPLLSAEERTLLLESWNRTEMPYPRHLCIHQLFEQQVTQTPDATALVYQDQSLSYRELNAQANRLAHHLIGLGVRPDEPVALCLERSPAMIVGLLAILKAGGAYLPLDPAYPAQRLAQILTEAAPRWLLCDRIGRHALGESANHNTMAVLDLTACTDWATLPETNPDPNTLGLSSQHLAYIIYTSGSTGTPKGTMVEHRSAVNFWQTMQRTTHSRLPPRSTIALNASFAFDMSLKGLLQLLTGHTLILIPQTLRANAIELLGFLVQYNVDAFDSVPSQMANLIAAGILDLKDYQPISILLGGEEISPAMWGTLRSSPIDFYNMYGPTEATVDATLTLVRENCHASNIGRPIANTRIYLLDARGEPVPLGATGEIYIGGDGVARGYLHRPELTAERFLTDPFSPHPNARMYRTGDLGRYLPDGNLEFLGRNDHQIKLRGFRIELGEIEAVLQQHPAVKHAVITVREDSPGEKRLVAYFIGSQSEPSPAELIPTLRAHLAARLPEYMVPAAFVQLQTLPLTPNGKLDRNALPAPEADAFAREMYEPPQGPIEQRLALIWEELLGVANIGRHDDFFELGGHSLLAVRLLSRLPGIFGIELPMAELYTHPVLCALAATVDATQQQPGAQILPAITPCERKGYLPLSFAQQRMWFLAQLEGVSQTYHVLLGLQLHGPLDSVAWQDSLNALFARHEALRSVFISLDGQPHVELLSPESGIALIKHDLRGTADAQQQLKRLRTEEATTPFDLARGPLIRARLIRLADQEHLFLLTQHHIVSDGWSMGVLAQELSALYEAFCQGRPNPLTPLAIQYPDYAAWQRRYLTGERQQAHAQYWRETLTGAPDFLALPTDRPRPPEQSFLGAHVPLRIDAQTTAALKRLGQQHGTTLFMTLMAAWATVLSRLSGQSELLIGTPTANRNRREIEPLLGLFVNTLALRIDLSGEPSVAELLLRVRHIALAAQDHQELPFEQVVEILQPPRRLDRTPLVQVMFGWQNNEQSRFALPHLTVSPAPDTYDQVRFDLELTLREEHEGISGILIYAAALFDPATIERHVGYLQNALRAMTVDSQQPVARLPLLSAEERTLLLESWNRTEMPYPRHLCIHQLFEQQVTQTPDATALVYQDQSLSYRELNAQANRLAHHLIGLGVRPDEPVALCLERSPAMIVGLLAILKAGGAYLPLDPSYPPERLRQLLADCQPALLLTDAHAREVLAPALSDSLAVIPLDQPGEFALRERCDNPNPAALGLTSRHLAYIIYTSGSTGTPKGAQNEHAALVNRLWWMQKRFLLGATDTVLQKTSFGFDVSAWEIFWPLFCGAKLVLAAPEDHKNPDKLIELICAQQITTAHFVPSMLHSFTATPTVERCTSLRRLICSGEVLTGSQIHSTQSVLPRAELHNLYGPTEAAIDVTAWACPADFDSSIVPIGRPIANTRIYLLDARGEPVPLGATGEIYIGGDGVARGYLHRPELTAERFLTDPFSPHPNARMYRTGDLGRYLPDGNLEFLGRNDHQIKLRGFRIELGEIEAVLQQHPAVKHAVITVREDSPGEKRLVAYFIGSQSEPSPAELIPTLRAHLAARLPEYMVPAAFVQLQTLPLTPNGKLDRNALPAPEADAFAREMYEPPQGPIEQRLALIWEELLGVANIGRHDDFFELGGHSLLAVRLFNRLLDAFGIELPMAELYTHPVLCALAATVDATQQQPGAQILPAISHIERRQQMSMH